MLFIGIIGEYVGTIHTVVRRRPLVIEQERINFEYGAGEYVTGRRSGAGIALQDAAQIDRLNSVRQIAQGKAGYPYWKWPIVICECGFLVYLALRGVEWKRVGNIVGHCHPAYLLLACSCATVACIVRAMRWRILLNAEEKHGMRRFHWPIARNLELPADQVRFLPWIRTTKVEELTGAGIISIKKIPVFEGVAK